MKVSTQALLSLLVERSMCAVGQGTRLLETGEGVTLITPRGGVAVSLNAIGSLSCFFCVEEADYKGEFSRLLLSFTSIRPSHSRTLADPGSATPENAI